MSDALTPRQIVTELSKYIIGQEDAKRMVAIAMRNRWRRAQLDPSLKEEIAPKNILMMGPTGVGKTEIARRLAKLAGSPFIKVEATKFTEVGYVGRDVESMVRDLMEMGVSLVEQEEKERVNASATVKAEERLLDLLLPPVPASQADYISHPDGITSAPAGRNEFSTRDKLRGLWRDGKLDDREVDIEVTVNDGPQVEMLAMPGMEQMGSQFKDMFGKMFPSKRKTRRMKVKDAYPLLVQEEAERLIDQDKLVELAKERVEQHGIIFIDEIDKVASSAEGRRSNSDISREGVQRDLLPIVEGSTVTTKYGLVRTDHILFIAAGAFHFSKPSDLIPELQGRFPLRVELSSLGAEEFFRILTEPHNALIKQYEALLGTEGIALSFTDDALTEIASFAAVTNKQTENIGARRLYTILEHILASLSFDASDRHGETIVIDKDYVLEQLHDVQSNMDLTRYIL